MTKGHSWAVSHTDQRIVVKNKKKILETGRCHLYEVIKCAEEDVHYIGMRQKMSTGWKTPPTGEQGEHLGVFFTHFSVAPLV